MRFAPTLLISAAFGIMASALPTAEPETLPVAVDGLDIPVYERDTDTANAPACHIIAYSGDHCGGNIGDPFGLPVCIGVGAGSGSIRK